VVVVAAFYPTNPLRQWIQESLLQHATSAHYELLYSVGSLSQETAAKFISEREAIFTMLDHQIGDAASNDSIRIVLRANTAPRAAEAPGNYTVDGATIRATLDGPVPQVNPAADAAALLYAAWGKAGIAEVGQWTTLWLASQWNREDLGMAAAHVEQRLGHTTVTKILAQQSAEGSPGDRNLLGAAWVNELAELGGGQQVRKLYSAKLSNPDLAAASQALGTTPSEVERKWQLWIFSYIAGMPAGQTMPMPANMPMKK
jgi:hypothetical protein